MIRQAAVLLVIALFSASSAFGGTFSMVDNRSAEPPFDPNQMQPFAIVHPPGYVGGSPGVVPVRICVRAQDPQLIPAVQMAIEMWNTLVPTTDNCENCVLWEEPTPPPAPLHAFSTVLHEMGHCVMGLGHPNLRETSRTPIETATGTCDVDEDGECLELTSFTNSGNATQIMSASGVRGSSDNDHQNSCPVLGSPVVAESESSSSISGEQLAQQEAACARLAACPSPPICCPACPGPDCPSVPMQTVDFSWHRISDNNPFVIDATVIDRDTFSRRKDLLPAGHNYAANANRGLGDASGFPNTQSVMYSRLEPGMKRTSLGADDVNMVRMGMTGVDRIAGTGDDYTIALIYDPECSTANVQVSLTDSFIGSSAQTGICAAFVRQSFSNSVHYSQTPLTTQSQIFIELNPAQSWDFDVPLIFRGTFESGNLLEWSNSSQSPLSP